MYTNSRNEEQMNDFISKISSAIDELEPVTDLQSENVESEIITFDGSEKDNSLWKALIAKHIQAATHFEIHCWMDEEEEIAMALQYGCLRDADWRHGRIIEGTVTKEFIAMLLNLPKPTNTMYSNKMTPFFSIFLDNGFSSEHYGTENIVRLAKR